MTMQCFQKDILLLVLLSNLLHAIQHRLRVDRHATFHKSIFQNENKDLYKIPFLFQDIRNTDPNLRRMHSHKDCGEIQEDLTLESMRSANDVPVQLRAELVIPTCRGDDFLNHKCSPNNDLHS